MQCRDTGPPDAKIILVGEAPGREEEMLGKPFVGAAGRLLKGLLANCDIDFNECFVTNIMSTRPPDNNFGKFYDDSNRKIPSFSLCQGWEALKNKIILHKPNLIIALGAEPLRALTGYHSIKAWRGVIIPTSYGKVLATYHPASVLRQYSQKPVVEIDLSRAQKEAKYREVRTPKYTLTLSPTYEQTLDYLASIKDVTAFDIETFPSANHTVRCIGFARSATDAICIPIVKVNQNVCGPVVKSKTIINLPSLSGGVNKSDTPSSYWTAEQETEIWNRIAKIFVDESIKKIGQNYIGYDIPELERQFGMKFKNLYMDTMHAFHVCYMELPKSLNFLTTVFTTAPNYWSNRDPAVDKDEWEYNAMDCAVCFEVYQKLETEMDSLNVKDLYFNHVHPLSIALTRAQNRGILIDVKKRKEVESDYLKQIKVKQKELDGRVGYPVNVKSFPVMSKLLYTDLKFPTMYSKKGTVTTDEEAIKTLLKKYPGQPMLELINGIRSLRTIISTFLRSKLSDEHLMHTSYNPSGTDTGRISSSKTIRGTGGNLQNIPKHTKAGEIVRRLFIPRDKKVFVRGDFSQAEARVVGCLLKNCGDSTLYELFKASGEGIGKFDIHRWHAANNIFKCSEDEVTYEQRFIAKTAIHSGNYGAGPKVLIKQALKFDASINISYQEAKEALINHRRAFGLEAWWRSVERELARSRTLTNCFGRKRIFFGRLDQATYRQAYAFVPQSTATGDLTNYMFTQLDKHLPSDSFPLLQVHDEVVVECPAIRLAVDKVVVLMRKFADFPLQICQNQEPLTIPFEIEVGFTWKDCIPFDQFKEEGYQGCHES